MKEESYGWRVLDTGEGVSYELPEAARAENVDATRDVEGAVVGACGFVAALFVAGGWWCRDSKA